MATVTQSASSFMTRSDGSEDERGAVPTFVTRMISGSRREDRATLLPARPQQ